MKSWVEEHLGNHKFMCSYNQAGFCWQWLADYLLYPYHASEKHYMNYGLDLLRWKVASNEESHFVFIASLHYTLHSESE